MKRSTHEFLWYNTSLSPKIEHAFHALAIDETRGPFSPAIWERLPGQLTDLRQVWFPGSHGDIGGGFPEQGISDSTLAWMMDQLASIGVEFIPDFLDALVKQNIDYYINSNAETEGKKRPRARKILRKKVWATRPIYKANHPIRPWSLHMIHGTGGFVNDLFGQAKRSPGRYKRINPRTGGHTTAPLVDTNERIHSSVRVRLACRACRSRTTRSGGANP